MQALPEEECGEVVVDHLLCVMLTYKLEDLNVEFAGTLLCTSC